MLGTAGKTKVSQGGKSTSVRGVVSDWIRKVMMIPSTRTGETFDIVRRCCTDLLIRKAPAQGVDCRFLPQ